MRRRDFMHCSLCASAGWLLGCDAASPVDAGPRAEDAGVDAGPPPPTPDAGDGGGCADPFAGGAMIGLAPFGDVDVPLDTRRGEGWDGRLYTDLSTVRASEDVIDNDRFYLRTFYPDLLVPPDPWTIAVSGLATETTISIDDVRALAEPQGLHVLECSGNGRGGGFGLLSAAAWAGAPMTAVLDALDVDPAATRVLVEGFDEHSVPSAGGHSTPGASWIFTFDQLAEAGAFLATEMNGVPLPADHGAPVRLYVPGWYGCTCIKWVTAIRLVDDDAPATSQMLEFAGRTHQEGRPAMARDYQPASMHQAAMPVRVEKWRAADGELLYRVIGILWGGQALTDRLQLVASGLPPVDVDVCPPMTTNQTWTVWQHPWRPGVVGAHPIDLVIDDPAIPTRRLDVGYYRRTVSIDEV